MSAKQDSYSEIFFNSKEEVRRRLAAAVLDRLNKNEGDYERIDSHCGFGKEKSGLPRCREVQADSQRLRSAFFSRAAYPLRLTLDKVLPLDAAKLTPELLSNVKKEMVEKGAGAVSGFPAPPDFGQEVSGLSRQENIQLSDEEATVYIWLKITDEIDADDTPAERTRTPAFLPH